MVFMRQLVGGLLAELEDDIDRDKFKRLLHYSRRLTGFQNRAKLVCKQDMGVAFDRGEFTMGSQVQQALDEVLEQGSFILVKG